MALWKNTHESYGRMARILHWLIAIIFLSLVISGVVADNLPRGELRSELFNLHKSCGVMILPLILLRVFWRFYNPPPTHLPMASWMVFAAAAVHVLLYAVMLIQPLSGLFMYLVDGRGVAVFDLFTVPPVTEGYKDVAGFLRSVHENNAYLIYALLFMHIGAALFHHFIVRDDVLRRMIGLHGKK